MYDEILSDDAHFALGHYLIKNLHICDCGHFKLNFRNNTANINGKNLAVYNQV